MINLTKIERALVARANATLGETKEYISNSDLADLLQLVESLNDDITRKDQTIRKLRGDK
jgi:hypothetical protein